ncbi:permease for cytosine/purines, uracil, thiamine, allantoin-domain-containing protein [Dipodascopsis tothii]|uniref:permease for cytosine/purines, uracil, thiamine, allantoin-domain-containing protein n=1 Tax=Dipodascopsis tothii TaxID=44089 RepID=UPI0034CFC8E1
MFNFSFSKLKSETKKKATSKSAWVLPKQNSSFAPADTWTNVDNDVTPLDRRTWTTYIVLGFWFSDALNMQGWEGPSSVINIGLTWREALISLIMGMVIIVIPLVLNGAVGAALHVPYPVAARASFGFNFAKFAVVTRMVTALFWHSIQTYSGSFALTLCIAAIWPSYRNIPNHIPASIGITTQQMVSHLLFWMLQFPILLIAPHKLRWFFIFKGVLVSACCIGVAAGMCKLASSSGDIWAQEPQYHGSERVWLLLSTMMSNAGGWATMATNIPDFTRYMKPGQASGQYWQAMFLPVIATFLAMMSILATSAAKVVYGSYIWDPTELASQWTGPGGRAGAFFVGLSWVVGQIGTNLSANVITAANDLTSLFPKYVNIRRGSIIITFIGGWVMQPWKIENSASQLLTFMSGLAIFLAPIAGILASDFWIVKNKKIDVPALYDPYGRYCYWKGVNWRAVVTFLVSMVPNLPGLAYKVGNVNISEGMKHLGDINYLYGFYSSIFTYVLLSKVFPAHETLITEGISGDDVIYEGKDASSEDVQDVPEEVEVTEKN